MTETEDFVRVSRFTQNKLLLLGGVISFSSIYQMGTSNAYVNTATDSFREYLNDSLRRRGIEMTDSMYTWIWSFILNSWFTGFALGSFIAIPVADNFGRIKGLYTGNGGTLITICLMVFGIAFQQIELFFIGRFFSAIFSAISMCALILFLQEIAPLSMRGKLSFFAEMSFVATNTIGMVMGMEFVLGTNLVLLIGLAVAPALFSIVIIYPLHETPKFLLIKKNNKPAAINAIKYYLSTDEENTFLVLKDLSETPKTKGESSCFDIFFIPHVRLGLILGIMALQITLSIWPVVFYSTEFLRRANVDATLAEYVSSVMLVISTISTFCGLLIVEKFNRRSIFLFSSAFNILSVIFFVVFSQLQPLFDFFKYACVGALFGHSISYSIALGPVAWFITAELVPTQYRCICQSVVLSFNQIMAFSLTLVVLPMYNLMGSIALLPLFVAPSIIAIVVLLIWLPETKGRDIQTIIDELCGHTIEEAIRPLLYSTSSSNLSNTDLHF